MSSLVENKKARLNYEIMDTYEAGIELFGFEVKSLKLKHGKLEGGHVIIRGGEAYLVGAQIPPHQIKNAPESYDPQRTRRLLLNKKEIATLAGKDKEKGLTLIPLSLYTKNRFIKLSFGIARPKKKYDKREDLKKKDSEREIRRTLKFKE